MENYIKDPRAIEEKSFEIITKELGKTNFSEKEGNIIKRVIHTTADFEYAELLEIHSLAIEKGITALRKGSHIYADTQMIVSGVKKQILSDLDAEIHNYVHHQDVYAKAKQLSITRSMAAMEKAVVNEKIKIFALGNAPTAVFALKELIEKGIAKPELIIAVPVGFVGAEESKEAITQLDIPYIITKGRKGGSPVAAAIINAMLLMV